MNNKKRIRIIDTTLRDGSHAVSHTFSPEQAEMIAEGLDRSGVFMVECAHGDGINGSSFNYGFSKYDERELHRKMIPKLKSAKPAVLLIPGVGTIENLKAVHEIGIEAVRVATHVTEADIGIQHIEYAKSAGMMAVGFLMMAHMEGPEKILEQARIFQDAGADYINVADSAGHMLPEDVKSRIGFLAEHLDIPVGFHAHNNLGLAIANSLAAARVGASYLDATCRGLGAGAGNAQLEVLVAVLALAGFETGVDLYTIQDVAEHVVEPVMQRPQIINTAALSLGYAGVYSSFLLHANRAAERFGLNPRDILMELGHRKMVGGQEDMIVDVAYALAQQRKKMRGLF